jgi:hypothetical protein
MSEQQESSSVSAKNQRKQLLINPPFQLKILNYITGLNLVMIAIFALVNYFFFERMRAEGVGAGLPENHVYFDFLQGMQSQMIIIFLAGAIVSVAIIYWFGFYISNRIAGPIYNVTRNIDRILNGERVMKIRFRKGDFFPELADKITALVEHYENKKNN